jgi:putative transposase
MKRTRHTPEQVINKLREAETMLAGGRTVAQVLQHLGVSEATFNRSRIQYGGMKSPVEPVRARRLKELEIENARLKRLVAEKELDIAILREASDYLGKPQAPRGGGRS